MRASKKPLLKKDIFQVYRRQWCAFCYQGIRANVFVVLWPLHVIFSDAQQPSVQCCDGHNVSLKSKSTKCQQKANLQDAKGLPWAEISRSNTQLQQTQVAPLPVVGFTLKWFQYTSNITTESSEYLQVTIMQKPRQQQQNDNHNNNGKCKNHNDNQKCKKHNNNDNNMTHIIWVLPPAA